VRRRGRAERRGRSERRWRRGGAAVVVVTRAAQKPDTRVNTINNTKTLRPTHHRPGLFASHRSIAFNEKSVNRVQPSFKFYERVITD